MSETRHYEAGSDGGARRWAVVGSLVETCKLNGVEPYAWLCDVLGRMVDGHPAQRLDELLPWNQAQALQAGLVVNEPLVQFDGR